MAKTYIEQLKEKADQVFRETCENVETANLVHMNDGTVEASIDHYSLGFNNWISDFGKACDYSEPIISDALMNVSTFAEVSIFLCLHGFQKNAVAELRGAFDSFLTRAYFGVLKKNGELKSYWVDDQGQFVDWCEEELIVKDTKMIGSVKEELVQRPNPPKEGCKLTDAYTQWLFGRPYLSSIEFNPKKIRTKRFPSKENILDLLFKERYMNEYNKKFELKKQIDDLYSELSKYSHDRPDKSYKLELSVESSIFNPSFCEEDFYKWFAYLKELYLCISTILILLYPGLLGAEEADRFEKYFPDEFKRIAQILQW